MNTLEKITRQFLNREWDKKSPLLLGLSGGPDSMALFHLLLEEGAAFSVAHVNHGWREESAGEAAQLQALAEKKKIPFYEKKLKQDLSLSNLEDRAREMRLAFFGELVKSHHFQALLLAHHADDQAETVLKRLFEGANLHHLQGLKEVSQFKGMAIWRPLLPVKKEEILSWLNEKKISYFIDKTNEESRFLRGRFRKELFPFLSARFGKNIAPSLTRIGRASTELSQFLEKVAESHRKKRRIQEGMKILDLSDESSLTSFEIKLIVSDFFKEEEMVLSASQLEAICLHLMRKSAHKELIVGKKKIELHHGQLYLPEGNRAGLPS